jgi:hypothetical protein
LPRNTPAQTRPGSFSRIDWPLFQRSQVEFGAYVAAAQEANAGFGRNVFVGADHQLGLPHQGRATRKFSRGKAQRIVRRGLIRGATQQPSRRQPACLPLAAAPAAAAQRNIPEPAGRVR